MVRKPQKRALDTRKKILDVAREMVVLNGYEALRTEEIVAKAGVAKGTLFAHFGDKDQLLFILICEEFDGTIGAIFPLLSQEAFSRDQFVEVLFPLVRLLCREKIIFDLFQFFAGVPMEQFSFDVDEDECSEFQELLTRGVFLLQENGEARKDVDAKILAEGCLAFLVQAASFRLSGQYEDIDEAEKEFAYKINSWLKLS